MKIVTSPSKSTQVAEFLKREILSGRLAPGERLATVRELAGKFAVSKKVIELAFDALESGKLLDRKDRSGTFVADWSRSKPKTAALYMRTRGHVYETQTNRLINQFQAHGFMTVVIDVDAVVDSGRTFLDELLERQVDFIVIDGTGAFPYAELEARRDRLPRLAFINRHEHEFKFEALQVLTDFEAGFYMATKHLLDTGRRRVMIQISDPVNFIDKSYYPSSGHAQSLAGYRRAVREAGAEELLFHRNDDNREALRDILQSRGRPDGVVSSMDYRAKDVMDLCATLGLKVPDDLAVVGYYNTPWAEMLNPALTSVSIQEELIAATLADKLLGGAENGRVVIAPELVVRQSCGAESLMEATK